MSIALIATLPSAFNAVPKSAPRARTIDVTDADRRHAAKLHRIAREGMLSGVVRAGLVLVLEEVLLILAEMCGVRGRGGVVGRGPVIRAACQFRTGLPGTCQQRALS
jgi:hypothetical protein